MKHKPKQDRTQNMTISCKQVLDPSQGEVTGERGGTEVTSNGGTKVTLLHS